MDDALASTLIDAAPDGLFLVDAAGVITMANRSAGELFGYSADDLIGMTVEQLVPADQRRRHVEHRRSYLDDPVPRPMGSGLQLLAEGADGDLFPVEISLSPVMIDGVEQTIATVRDVSERQETLSQVALLNERERIARDLHDMVIQRLFAAGMGLQGVAASTEPTVATRLLQIADELDETIRELRAAIFGLGHVDEDRSLSGHLAELVDDRSRDLGFRPTLRISGRLDSVPDYIAEQLVATLNEALSNVGRHANATAAEVRVTCTNGSIELKVSDDGVGIVGAPKQHGGLSNLMWRAAELGGRCTIGANDPSGTALSWNVPL